MSPKKSPNGCPMCHLEVSSSSSISKHSGVFEAAQAMPNAKVHRSHDTFFEQIRSFISSGNTFRYFRMALKRAIWDASCWYWVNSRMQRSSSVSYNRALGEQRRASSEEAPHRRGAPARIATPCPGTKSCLMASNIEVAEDTPKHHRNFVATWKNPAME